MTSKQAIQAAGGAFKISVECDISVAAIYKWVTRGIPYKYHALIADLTGLSAHEIEATRPKSPTRPAEAQAKESA